MAYKLLLADDSITIQKVVGIIFSNEDYELTIVDNGAAAVDKAKETIPDLMLIDAIMPGKNGYEVCEEVRRDPRLTAVPILLLTGVFEPFDEEKAKRSGADDYISKPFESQHLLDKVKNLVQLGHSRAAAVPAAPQAPVFEAPSFEDGFTPTGDLAAPSFGESYSEPTTVPSPWETTPPLEDFAPVMEPSASFAEPEEEGGGVVIEELSESDDLSDVVPLTAGDLAEAAPGDDLWGALELEEPAEEENGFGVVPDEEPETVSAFAASAVPSFATREPGGFESPWASASAGEELSEAAAGNAWDESPVGSAWNESEPSAPSAVVSGAPAFAPAWDVKEEAEEISSFVPLEEEPVAAEAFAPAAAFAGREAFCSPAAVLTPSDDVVFAPEEEFVPAQEPSTAAPAVEPAQGSATVTLSEEQLAAVIAKISKDVIERIAWEVVPDLAEALIKDEIRKITGAR